MIALAITHRSANWLASAASLALTMAPQSWLATTILLPSFICSVRMPSINSAIASNTSFGPYLGKLSLPP